ncbi:acetyl-CoA carboxylase [Streptococcus phocae]|uniref:Biotin carboxyl carrier protein of acetyl-CoA carboxylase n=2 Tax=Streptococcus phocae TaxID=119224 RepID=A0A0P6S2R4_9STRE|nr:acetyl-CoA carboxylase biotin carboxyl carrier protein [Streptococcus phocae]KPJ22852.1 acetyl-CoA carboxylase [Streptococcus phocae]
MEITHIKDLMAQFDASSLKEFSFKSSEGELSFSKNEYHAKAPASYQESQSEPENSSQATPIQEPVLSKQTEPLDEQAPEPVLEAEGDLVKSPLVGVAYLAASPDSANFVSVGDTVKKGQTLLIIEAMKVMNEVPAPSDGVVTEILVDNETVIEFGQGLVRIK